MASMPQQRKTTMSKSTKKGMEPKSPAKPDNIAKDAELSEEQLKEVLAGSCVGAHYTKVTLQMRKAGG
jgi:hypothetical protein